MDERIAALAAGQHGVVSRAQLLEARIAESTIDVRVGSGELLRLHRGVYAVGHAHLRPNGYRLAAVLAVGSGAVLSHRDAAALHGIRDGGGTRIDVSTPAERRSTQRIRVAATGTTLTRSHLEDRFLSLLEAHDLPRPATNAYVAGYECDAVWRAERLAVELDGWDGHKTRRAFQHDRTKGNAVQNAGYALLRFTHADVTRRPHETAAAIAAQLSRAA